MADRALLVTNNPYFSEHKPDKADVRHIDGDGLAVLIAARDLAHKGWTLANHPLYGNFRPHQQPYRSLVMLPPAKGKPDQELCSPLYFLEEALALYQGPCPKCSPDAVPGHYAADCSQIDSALLAATLASLD